MFNPKDLKSIREILDFLNAEFKGLGLYAFCPKVTIPGMWGGWHLCTSNYDLYTNEDFRLHRSAVCEVYTTIKIIFTCQSGLRSKDNLIIVR